MPDGIDPKTKEALILYFDTTAVSIDDRPTMNWYRKQFEKLGIKLVIRATDYNRFQEKMRAGNAQIFVWGWNADYPDPENFFFLLYGAKFKSAARRRKCRSIIRILNSIAYLSKCATWITASNVTGLFSKCRKSCAMMRRGFLAFIPKNFSLFHGWYKNLKPNLMANNQLKYTRIDTAARAEKRQQWNKPVFWPLVLGGVLFVLMLIPAVNAYRRRVRETMQ